MAKNDILVELKGMLPTPSGSGILLSNGIKTISIFIDSHVASAINMFMQNVRKPRPLTHDLMLNIMAGLGVTLEKVVIHDFQEETYYARLYLRQQNDLGENVLEVDARPSDSMALAIQFKSPIMVAQKVWEQSPDMTDLLQQIEEEMDLDGDDDQEEDFDDQELEDIIQSILDDEDSTAFLPEEEPDDEDTDKDPPSS